MRRLLTAAVLSGLCLAAFGAKASGQDAGARARELAANFDKQKHKVKEKRGVRVDVFVEVHAEPAARASAADYSGRYESDSAYSIELRVGADGSVEGGGTEPAPGGARRFTLRDAKVSGAVLTGTKVYDGGGTEQLEAVFINLNIRNTPNGTGPTLFGLGVVFDPSKTDEHNFEIQRLFYALKP